MSPLEIEIALYYHYSGADEDFPPRGRAGRETLRFFEEEGLLRPSTPEDTIKWQFQPTERLHVFVTEGLCKVQLPVNKWVIPRE